MTTRRDYYQQRCQSVVHSLLYIRKGCKFQEAVGFEPLQDVTAERKAELMEDSKMFRYCIKQEEMSARFY